MADRLILGSPSLSPRELKRSGQGLTVGPFDESSTTSQIAMDWLTRHLSGAQARARRAVPQSQFIPFFPILPNARREAIFIALARRHQRNETVADHFAERVPSLAMLRVERTSCFVSIGIACSKLNEPPTRATDIRVVATDPNVTTSEQRRRPFRW